MNRTFRFCAIVVLLAAGTVQGHACSVFCIDGGGQLVVGQNLSGPEPM